MTSESTQTEEVALSINHPDTWQVICNGNLFQTTDSMNVSLQYSRGEVSEQQYICSLHRLKGTLDGELIVSMETLDQTISSSSTQMITFSDTEDDDSFMNVEMNAPTMITGGIALIMLMLISLIIRRKSIPFDEEFNEIQGPPITNGPPVSQTNTPMQQPVIEHETSSPTIPDSGLPEGWSMEQWQHYGQQYLDRLGKQP